jgi:hypothetical protein
MQIFSEWVGAAVKQWVLFHPVKQTWFNRGRRTLDSSRFRSHRLLRHSLATYVYAFCLAAFAFAVGTYIGAIPFLDELPLVHLSTVAVPTQGTTISDFTNSATPALRTAYTRAYTATSDFTTGLLTVDGGSGLDAERRPPGSMAQLGSAIP